LVTNLLQGKRVPVYDNGLDVRDWIYVMDYCKAIDFVLQQGADGEVYNIGGGEEKTNMEITRSILRRLGKDEHMIEYVRDRPGHDLRYSLDCSNLKAMGWRPEHNFEEALELTVKWYIDNQWWWEKLKH
jgi:dTDP-glucose 4,6-dehydratase